MDVCSGLFWPLVTMLCLDFLKCVALICEYAIMKILGPSPIIQRIKLILMYLIQCKVFMSWCELNDLLFLDVSGDITPQGFEKKKAKLLAPYLSQTGMCMYCECVP